MQSLARNIGSAIGISVTSFSLTRSVQVTHADIAAGITPFDRVLQGNDAVSHMLNPATRHGAALLDQMINHQAQIIAYNNDFRLMMLTVCPAAAAAVPDAQERAAGDGGGGLRAGRFVRQWTDLDANTRNEQRRASIDTAIAATYLIRRCVL